MSTIYGLIDGDTLELRYVGQTHQMLDTRFSQHRRGRSTNLHLRHWLAARPVNIITLERDPDDLNEAERRWIREMRAAGARLLNLTDGGDYPPSWLGKQHTPETCAKISASLAGYKPTPAHRAKLSAAKVGSRASSETRAKMSAAKMGNQNALGFSHSDGARVKMSASRLGRKHTPEARAKISAVAMGNQHWLGRKHTEETRAKMRLAWVLRRSPNA